MTPVFNIIVGVAMIAAGASGKFTLLGTQSSTLLAAVGVIPLVMGIHQLWKRRARRRP